jgi:hypothetical protein
MRERLVVTCFSFPQQLWLFVAPPCRSQKTYPAIAKIARPLRSGYLGRSSATQVCNLNCLIARLPDKGRLARFRRVTRIQSEISDRVCKGLT